MGAWLAERQLLPDFVVSSPATRASETAALVLEALGLDPTPSRWDRRIYGASTGELLELLAEVPADSKRTLLIGHNPGFEMLVRRPGQEPARLRAAQVLSDLRAGPSAHAEGLARLVRRLREALGPRATQGYLIDGEHGGLGRTRWGG